MPRVTTHFMPSSPRGITEKRHGNVYTPESTKKSKPPTLLQVLQGTGHRLHMGPWPVLITSKVKNGKRLPIWMMRSPQIEMTLDTLPAPATLHLHTTWLSSLLTNNAGHAPASGPLSLLLTLSRTLSPQISSVACFSSFRPGSRFLVRPSNWLSKIYSASAPWSPFPYFFKVVE